jgi:hypothetical protein
MHGNITRKILCSYLYLKLTKKVMFFFLSFIFFFYKIREQEDRTGPGREWGEKEGAGNSVYRCM